MIKYYNKEKQVSIKTLIKNMKKFKVNESKCTGCEACIRACPNGATKIGANGKAEIIDQEKLEQCGGEIVCPIGAIEKVNRKREPKTEISSRSISQQHSYLSSLFDERGKGRRMGVGRGRGPRDGSGGGKGGGGRRR